MRGGTVAGINPPASFGQFRRVGSLAKGGMGDVWLFEDIDLHRTVALKFIADPQPDEERRERFVTEGLALARIAHPNVVTVHRVGEVEGLPYLMTEFVRGTPVKALATPMRRADLLELAIGLARGLAAVHERGILHRDIKPSNAIVPEKACETENGKGTCLDFANVKLLDFGLAKFVDGAPGTISEAGPAAGVTLPGAVLGTLLYMAPECRRGEAATARSDVYSLGAVLYDLCTGSQPATERQTRELAASDRALGTIVDRCLRQDPAERYGTAQELLAALARMDPRARYPAQENPYRGLHPFDEEHHVVFFGREREADDIIHRLREERFVLVAGDSGVGKSSLCRAGIVPRVRDGAIDSRGRACVLRLVPGRRPLRALAEAIAPLRGADAEALEPWLRSDPRALPRALPTIPGVTSILLFADQLEELLTVADRKEAEAFCCAIAALCGSDVPARVLGAVRGDFFTRLAALPDLGELVPGALFVLRPMRREGLRKTILEPARAAGVGFESPATVDELVAEAEVAPGGLPLLEFTMAELWEARDLEAAEIPAAAIGRLGGVGGALARHADEVIERLLPEEQAAARRVFVQLVTAEGTRSRAPASELTREWTDPAAARALEGLVRGRLVVAHKSEGGATEYEVAHEALLTRWQRLREWLEADGDRRQIRKRIDAAAKEWDRLGRRRDTLWDRRHLREAARVDRAELDALQLAFLDASSRHVLRTKQKRFVLLAAGPIVAMLAVGIARWRTQAELEARASERWSGAAAKLAEARRLDELASRSREEALLAYAKSKTADDWAFAQKSWTAVAEQLESADAAYERAELTFASALAIDPLHARARANIVDAVLLRATLARRFGDRHAFASLAQRLAALPGADGAAQLFAPARLTIDVEPHGTSVSIAAFATVAGRTRPLEPRLLGSSPLVADVPPGSHLLIFRDAISREFRLPILVEGGESIPVTFAIPSSVPDGYVYVPPGRFLSGFGENERLRRALNAPPAHVAATGPYFIARQEVTFQDYAAFLDSLTAAERAKRLPLEKSNRGSLELRKTDGGWELTLRHFGLLQATANRFRALWGEPIIYPKRVSHTVQDWRRFPVAAISLRDAQAYAKWISSRGLPGAHVCNDYEWERAARGADGRNFTTGDVLVPGDVNIDETYGREPSSFGPDEVGSHPESDSVFGVQDMVGNAMEMVISVEGFGEGSIRGGSWYYDEWSARLPARFPLEETTRSAMVGFRICAPAGG